MRKPLIAGNWKMHKTATEAVELARGILEKSNGISDVEVVLAPPFTALHAVKSVINGSNLITLAAQNVFWEEHGAFTGEISPGMLKDSGCEWVIIGHSERRQYFGETDKNVNRKIKAAIRAGLKPILCVGETLSEREAEKTRDIVKSQVKKGLEGISPEEFADITIAYEPVWAIGTGKTATNAQAEEVHMFIRNLLAEMFGEGPAENCRILYGGSVKPDNAAGLLAMPNVDGALVGGASLKDGDFNDIIRASLK